MRSTQLAVVVVVMVVGTAPDAARTQRKDAEEPHENLRGSGSWQNGVMLLIVIDDEQAQEQEAAKAAADQFCCRIKIPVCPGQRDEGQKGRRKDMPPTFPRGIPGVHFSC